MGYRSASSDLTLDDLEGSKVEVTIFEPLPSSPAFHSHSAIAELLSTTYRVLALLAIAFKLCELF